MSTHNTSEEQIDIAIANLVFSGLSIAQMEKIPKWLLESIEKNKTKFKETIHQELQKARREEREAFCTILEKLYQAGDDRKQMTFEYLMRILSKDAAKTPDQSELDQPIS